MSVGTPKLHRTITGAEFPVGGEYDAKSTSPHIPNSKRGRWFVRREADRFAIYYEAYIDQVEHLLAEYPPTDTGELDAKTFALTTELKTASHVDRPALPQQASLDAAAFYRALGSLTRSDPDGNVFISNALEGYALINEMPTFCWNYGRIVHTLTHHGGFEWMHENSHKYPAPQVIEGGDPYKRFYCWIIADLTQASIDIEAVILVYLGFLADRGHAALAVPLGYEFSPAMSEQLAAMRVVVEGACKIGDGGGSKVILLYRQAEKIAVSKDEMQAAYDAACIVQFSERKQDILSGKIVTLRGKNWICAGGSLGHSVNLYRAVPWDKIRRPQASRTYAGIVFKIRSSPDLWFVTGEQADANYDPSMDGHPRPCQLAFL